MKKTELATVEKQTEQQGVVVATKNVGIDVLLEKAVEKSVPVETMERLLAMRRELKAEAAKEAFDADMASLQSELLIIEKKRVGGVTSSGKVAYKYASLDDIIKQIKHLLAKHNFSYMIQTDMKEDKVKVTCIVKHTAGHQESTTIEMPLFTRTNVMNAPQQVAATITFGKRYAFCNAFGILTADDDNDAQEIEELSDEMPKAKQPSQPSQPQPAPKSQQQSEELKPSEILTVFGALQQPINTTIKCVRGVIQEVKERKSKYGKDVTDYLMKNEATGGVFNIAVFGKPKAYPGQEVKLYKVKILEYNKEKVAVADKIEIVQESKEEDDKLSI